MQKPKRSPRKAASYWQSISEDHLLAVELTIDDPTTAENLVFEVPEGDEEPYMEYVYDQRKSGRDKFHCVHGNHAHLFGCVMNKGGKRFLVGWICGKEIYGEDFKLYKKDFDYAADRQQVLRRVREVKAVIDPFLEWVTSIADSEAFNHYEGTKEKLRQHMSWLTDQLKWHTNAGGGVMGGSKLPAHLFDGFSDPRAKFSNAAAEIAKLGLLLIGKAELEKDAGITLARMQQALTELEEAVKALHELVDFFQPSVLVPICEWATENDNPKKRRYKAELGAVTCKREKSDVTIRMPKNYLVPNLAPIQTFRAALSGF